MAEIIIIMKIIVKPLTLIQNNTGNAHINKARQVNQKANAGLHGSIFEIATRVIGIVILNKNIPIIHKNALLKPNNKKGIDNTSTPTEILIHPNLSAKNHHIHFHKTIAVISIINRLKSVFQGKEILNPTNDLIATENKTNINIIPK